MLCAQLSRGDITRHRQVYHGATLFEAALYARELGREARLEEFNRQKLYEVVNRSAGGDYAADRSLLDMPQDATAPNDHTVAQDWMILAECLGQEVPETFRRLAGGLNA